MVSGSIIYLDFLKDVRINFFQAKFQCILNSSLLYTTLCISFIKFLERPEGRKEYIVGGLLTTAVLDLRTSVRCTNLVTRTGSSGNDISCTASGTIFSRICFTKCTSRSSSYGWSSTAKLVLGWMIFSNVYEYINYYKIDYFCQCHS